MNNKQYDIVIVGAGPTGLALAQCLSNIKGKKILIIDREKTIGGCHRVIRDKDELFTEHGPRIYISNYKNVFSLINEIGLELKDVFILYRYSIIDLLFSNILPNITFNEIIILTLDFLYYMYDENYGNNINYEKYLKDNKFSEKIIDIFDRLFRFLDGAELSKYSLNKVQNIFNIATFIDIYQPIKPLDVGLFNHWKVFLEKKGVDFLLETNVEKINYEKGKIVSVNANNKLINLDKLILAVPPISMSKILENNDINVKNCFGNLDSFKEWSEKTEYIEYISIAYHFINDIDIPNVSGATLDTDWGIVCIYLSNYMKDIEKNYKKLLSAAITITDRKSSFINKTANECSEKELLDEVYRQLKESIYPKLPNKEFYKGIINPNSYYKDGKWNCKDEAFFNTIGTKYLKNTSDTIDNIYNAGSHNGNSYIHYTTMDCAVSNGLSLGTMLYPELKEKYKLKTFLSLKDYLFYLFIIIIVLLIIYLLIANYN
jgi:protoporphyrinogen oxidase